MSESFFSPEAILNEIKELEHTFKELYENPEMNRVLFLGPSGSGKTTIIHLLSGCKMTINCDSMNNSYLCCDGKCRATFLPLGNAHRKVFHRFIRSNGQFLIDCPDIFNDLQIEDRIINNYALSKLFAPPCQIKILIVLPYKDFLLQGGELALKYLEQIENFFLDFYQIKECVGLVITHYNKYVDPMESINMLSVSESVNSRLLNFFDDNDDRCFMMNSPMIDSIDQIYNFKDINRILEFLKKGATKNPKPNITIDPNTAGVLSTIYTQMSKKMNECFIDFINDLSTKFRNADNVDEIKKWIQKIENLRAGALQGITKFHQVITHYSEFQYMKKKIDLFLVMDMYYDTVVDKTTPQFKFTDLIEKLDNQIEELRNMKDEFQNQKHLITSFNQKRKSNSYGDDALTNTSSIDYKEDLSPEEIIAEIAKLEKDVENLFTKENSKKTRILFLGPTGSGKTTLMHLLSGCHMIADNRGTLETALYCDGKCRVGNMKIGHLAHAETCFPAIDERNDYILCDCPGFLDTRSISQRILNAFSIGRLLTSPCKIKILLFLTYSHFTSDRCSGAIRLIDEAEKFFCDYNQIEQCIGLVITQVDHDQTVSNILKYVIKNRSKNHRLLYYFYEHQEKCFLVYKAKQGQEYYFNYKQQLLNFMKNGAINNPEHNIIMDKETLQTLCLTCDQMNDKMNSFLKDLANNIAEKHKNAKNIDDINFWIKNIEQLRYSAKMGINQFYLDLSKSNEFNWAKKSLNSLNSWNIFYDQVISKSTLSYSKKQLFNLNGLLSTFDDQIDDLRNKRNYEESQIQWARDKSVISITHKLNDIIRSGNVNNNQWVNFFDVLEKHPLHYYKGATKMKNIPVETIEEIDGVIHGKMDNKSLRQLVRQMEHVIRYSLKIFELIPPDQSKVSKVMNRLRTTDLHPYEMKMFKKYVPTAGNKAAGVFEMIIHPLKIVSSIPVGVGHVIKPALKKEKDIDNVNKMEQWFFDGTLNGKIKVFNGLVVPLMKVYGDIAKLCDKEYAISFSFGGDSFTGFPFYDYQQILPNDSHVSIITQCRSMTNILRDTSKNSMVIYNSISSLYHQVIGEIFQIKIDMSGLQHYLNILQNKQFDKTLNEILNDLEGSKTSTDDKIVFYSQVLATTRMIGAIYGRGIGSQARKDLFGIKTTVNCQTEDGKVCIYNSKNIHDINQNIVIHFQDLVCDLEYSDDKTAGFTPDSFVKTSREYIKKFEEAYEKSKNNLKNVITSIFSSLKSEIKDEPNQNDKKPNPDGEKLLDDLQKVDGVKVKKINENKFSMLFKGSLIKVAIGKLLNIAPLIYDAVLASNKNRELKEKYKTICSYSPLIRFYQFTTKALEDPNFLGVIITLDDKNNISFEKITLDLK